MKRTAIGLLLALAVAVAAVLSAVPELRWRAQLVAFKLVGQLPDVTAGELSRMLVPGSGFYLEPLAQSRNPYSAISNPYTGEHHLQQGKQLFGTQCALCHGAEARGETGPGLVARNLVHGDSDWAMFKVIRNGVAGTAMPAHAYSDETLWSLIAHIRRLQASTAAAVAAPALAVAPVTPGRLLGTALEPHNWLTYSGSYDGSRHSRLARIDRSNAAQLTVKWVHQFNGTERIVAATPIVNNGVMYVTEPPNTVHALEAATGKSYWSYVHTNATPVSHCCGTVNRGVAVHEDSVFMGTMDNHVIALDARTGKERWKVKLAEHGKGASISAAPLVVGDKLIIGYGGGDLGFRGFLDALSVKDGSRLWRFHTIPGPGEPGHDTWKGDSWKRGGGGTWLTGVYDPALKLLYWAVGNPGPDYQGDARPGDNLYTCSVLALDPDTGTLKWHFQFTPHDERDWAANQVPTLVDLPFGGRTRKLMLWANRNGFFYVLDRESGEFLRATPFVEQNWAKGIDSKGRPIVDERVLPDLVGKLTHPGPIGATNWQAPSYSPKSGLFYVATLQWPQIIYKDSKPADYQPGRPYLGGGFRSVPGNESLYYSVRAIDPLDGRIVWSYDSPKRRDWSKTGGLVSTAGDIVFGGDGTDLFALDAESGRQLWRLNVGGRINASPISFEVDGRQFLTLAAGRSIVTVGLP